MSHFAELNPDNVVLRVVVGDNSMTDADGLQWCIDNLGGRWVQCSYNGRIRKQYPGPGFTYDPAADVFVAPRPYPSWTLDANHDWHPPAPMPQDGKLYQWDESSLSWVAM